MTTEKLLRIGFIALTALAFSAAVEAQDEKAWSLDVGVD